MPFNEDLGPFSVLLVVLKMTYGNRGMRYQKAWTAVIMKKIGGLVRHEHNIDQKST